MLLQRILVQLDAELKRLLSIRKIVAGLPEQSIMKIVTPKLELSRDVEQNGRELPRSRERPRERSHCRRPAVHRVKASVVPEPTALAKAAFSGPVVVSAKALAEERERRAALLGSRRAQAEVAGLDMSPSVLAKELAGRWLSSTN